MTPERYERLCKLFEQVSVLSASDRAGFLANHCDASLRDELQTMLDVDQSSQMWIDADATSEGDGVSTSDKPCIEGYQLEVPVGRGGMGTVWRAVHLGTSREVALKLVSSHQLQTSLQRARFQREVQLCAKLNHPNIARIYDNGFSEDYAFYSMELIDGQPIDRFAESQELSVPDRVRLMAVVCRAVEHAHQRGIIHRDLKPSNILVSGAGVPFVLDFGLAIGNLDKPADKRLSISGEILGTPTYMSPEQAAGKNTEIDTRSDVYSLGVVLFGLVTGETPHDTTGSVAEVLRRIALEPIRLPRECNPTIDRDIEAILIKALSHRPDDRYNSAGELAADITHYLEGAPVLARAPSLGYLTQKWFRAHATMAVVASLVALLLMTGTVVFLITAKRHERQALELAETANRQRAAAQKARSASEQVSYALQLQLAAEDISNYRLRRAAAFLDTFPQEYRGWEWGFLHRQANQTSSGKWTTHLATEPVRRITVSPDGRLLALAVGKNTIKKSTDPHILLIDAESGESLRRLDGHTDGVFAVAFTPDGKQLVSGGRDGMLCRWDIHNGTLLESFAPTVQRDGTSTPLFIFDIAISNEWLAFSGNPAGLFVTRFDDSWDDFKLATVFEMAQNIVPIAGERGRIEIAPTQRHLVWVTRTWEEEVGHLYVVRLPELDVMHYHRQPPGNPFTYVNLSADGRHFVTSSFDGIARVWDLEACEVKHELRGHEGMLRAAAFLSRVNKVVTLGSDELIRVWDLPSSQTVSAIYASSEASGVTLAISPDRQRLYSLQQPAQSLTCWSMESHTNPSQVIVEHAGKIRDSAVHPSGDYVASAGEDGLVQLFDLKTESAKWQSKQGRRYVTAVAFSHDGQRLAVGRSDNPNTGKAPLGEVRILHVVDGKLIQGPIPLSKWVWDLQFDPTDRFIAIGTGVPGPPRNQRLSEAYVLDTKTETFTTHVRPLGARCRGVAFAPQSGALITASESELALWNRPDGQQLASHVALEGRNFVTVQDALIVTGNQSSIEFRDPKTLERHRVFEQTRYLNERFGFASVADVSFAPDGSRMVSCAWNNTLTIWDRATGRALLTFRAHDAGAHHVSFVPDGTSIVSSAHDGKVKIWRGRD